MHACYWDIECSHLKANFAVMLSAAIKPAGGNVEVFSDGRKGSNDKQLCNTIARRLEDFDILIGYYSLGFDLPMLNARLIKWGLRPLDERFHIDVYRVVKKNINTHSRRLQVVSHFFGIEGKDAVDPEAWVQAAYDGDLKAMRKIIEHNKQDVIVLEKTFEKIKHKMRSISKA